MFFCDLDYVSPVITGSHAGWQQASVEGRGRNLDQMAKMALVMCMHATRQEAVEMVCTLNE